MTAEHVNLLRAVESVGAVHSVFAVMHGINNLGLQSEPES
jgi:hypothetical protein